MAVKLKKTSGVFFCKSLGVFSGKNNPIEYDQSKIFGTSHQDYLSNELSKCGFAQNFAKCIQRAFKLGVCMQVCGAHVSLRFAMYMCVFGVHSTLQYEHEFEVCMHY